VRRELTKPVLFLARSCSRVLVSAVGLLVGVVLAMLVVVGFAMLLAVLGVRLEPLWAGVEC
jgi:hypothetical protein